MGRQVSENPRRKSKKKIKAPCGFFMKDEETGEEKYVYPPVDCDEDCEVCGFNPKVAKERIEQRKKRGGQRWQHQSGKFS